MSLFHGGMGGFESDSNYRWFAGGDGGENWDKTFLLKLGQQRTNVHHWYWVRNMNRVGRICFR